MKVRLCQDRELHLLDTVSAAAGRPVSEKPGSGKKGKGKGSGKKGTTPHPPSSQARAPIVEPLPPPTVSLVPLPPH